MVPVSVAAAIKKRKLFGYTGTKANLSVAS
jgi:hypothetical protein